MRMNGPVHDLVQETGRTSENATGKESGTETDTEVVPEIWSVIGHEDQNVIESETGTGKENEDERLTTEAMVVEVGDEEGPAVEPLVHRFKAEIGHWPNAWDSERGNSSHLPNFLAFLS